MRTTQNILNIRVVVKLPYVASKGGTNCTRTGNKCLLSRGVAGRAEIKWISVDILGSYIQGSHWEVVKTRVVATHIQAPSDGSGQYGGA